MNLTAKHKEKLEAIRVALFLGEGANAETFDGPDGWSYIVKKENYNGLPTVVGYYSTRFRLREQTDADELAEFGLDHRSKFFVSEATFKGVKVYLQNNYQRWPLVHERTTIELFLKGVDVDDLVGHRPPKDSEQAAIIDD